MYAEEAQSLLNGKILSIKFDIGIIEKNAQGKLHQTRIKPGDSAHAKHIDVILDKGRRENSLMRDNLGSGIIQIKKRFRSPAVKIRLEVCKQYDG